MNLEEIINAAVEKRVAELVAHAIGYRHDDSYSENISGTQIERAVEICGGEVVEWFGGQEHATAGWEHTEVDRLLEYCERVPRQVDAVIVGTDRTTYTGDVANKIGTYLKALAAKDNRVPFYVALPSSSFDWRIRDGVREIPIEERSSDEVNYADGWHDGELIEVRLTPETSAAANFGFDVTPRQFVTGLITERGICQANEQSILELFPEHVIQQKGS